MPFSLDQVVPWGRSFDEYVRMFALTEVDLGRRILGCADGPAAFNAELTGRGGTITSCDPLYQFSAAEIEDRIDACFETVLEQTRANQDGFVWSDAIPTVEALGQVRRQAMQTFLKDFEAGKQQQRYVPAELPELPFPDGAFDLALCSHFLFLYPSLGRAFHVESVVNLLRVASEVRIFPLLQLDRQRSPFVEEVIGEVTSLGHVAEVVRVPYEFQKGADEMLVITDVPG
ncbi:SAM-dependent methyltransferase [Blastopirellula marina]|uniref:SAM-dependent methyltransferase n=1 Tax=Blastopirellula marina TaxID=124 RepID=A0A2S8GL93_9BACT|nr:SAM-dependent methyltransferase [Blastopirellula marina]PQO45208.1 SAM-dependent methyltransferase [Blastopirellula marina]